MSELAGSSLSGDGEQVTVVIPVRNGADTLDAQLRAIVEASRNVSAEVVIADNGSTDSTRDVALSWSAQLDLAVVDASRSPGINVARNDGVRAASHSLILLCDADDEVDVRWIDEMVAEFRAGSDVVGGTLDYTRLNAAAAIASRGAESASPMVGHGFLPFGHGANLAFRREVWDSVGGFDESFRGGGDDVDFCWRAQLAGYSFTAREAAVVRYLLRAGGSDVWRQARGYARSEAQLYRKFRDQGMDRRDVTAAFGDVAWIVARSWYLASPRRRPTWMRKSGEMVGRVEGAIRNRVVWW